MKNAWIVAFALLFVSVAGFFPTLSRGRLTGEKPAAVLGQPGVRGSCAPQEGGVLFAARRSGSGAEKALCTATVNCGSSTISCQGNNSTATCTAVNRNCPERGHVTCGGVTTSCPVCSACDNCSATG